MAGIFLVLLKASFFTSGSVTTAVSMQKTWRIEFPRFSPGNAGFKQREAELQRRYLHVCENVSFVYPEIYCGRCFFFICISDSQRIESCHGTSEGIEHIIWKQCILSNAISLMHWMRIVAQTAVLDFLYITTSTCPCWLSSCGYIDLLMFSPKTSKPEREKIAFSTRQNHKPVVLQVKLCFVSG